MVSKDFVVADDDGWVSKGVNSKVLSKWRGLFSWSLVLLLNLRLRAIQEIVELGSKWNWLEQCESQGSIVNLVR